MKILIHVFVQISTAIKIFTHKYIVCFIKFILYKMRIKSKLYLQTIRVKTPQQLQLKID